MPKQPGITVYQRRALRQLARQLPCLRQRQLKLWFEAEFHRTVNPNTISDSLSTKYSYLDSEVYHRPSQQRRTPPKWPALDQALFDWQQERDKDKPITAALIKQQAACFWKSLPCYRDMEAPKFSNGWLKLFKRRHNITFWPRPGEDGSVDHAAITRARGSADAPLPTGSLRTIAPRAYREGTGRGIFATTITRAQREHHSARPQKPSRSTALSIKAPIELPKRAVRQHN